MWTVLESSADKTAHLPEFDEPLVLGEESATPVPWRRIMAYASGCIVLLCCLMAQILFFYPEYFLRHAFWRPLLVEACQSLNCELPAEKNAEVLRSVLLTVEPHPQYQQMLLVQFRAQNTAMYPLEFPAAELLFSNPTNNVLAGRRFQPQHYLNAALLAEGFIASGAEISGELAISSPGDDAVNYTLEFVYDN